MTVEKTIRIIASILSTLLFVWLVARQISLAEIKTAFIGTTTSWIVAALLAFAVGYACRVERWRLMLIRENSGLKWHECAGPFFASFAANNVLPFRIGDVLRAFAFNSRLGVSPGVVVATLIVERILDLLMILLLLVGVLSAFSFDTRAYSGIGTTVLIGIAFGILLLVIYPRVFVTIALAVGKFAARVAPNVGGKLLSEIDKSLVTFLYLAKGSTMLRLAGWSIAAWLAEGCVFWFAALALSSIEVPAAGWLALPVGTLATLIPSTPGYIGTFDYFTVGAMSAVGNGTVAATAYALLVHVLLWLPATLIGGIYLLLRPPKKQNKVGGLLITPSGP